MDIENWLKYDLATLFTSVFLSIFTSLFTLYFREERDLVKKEISENESTIEEVDLDHLFLFNFEK